MKKLNLAELKEMRNKPVYELLNLSDKDKRLPLKEMMNMEYGLDRTKTLKSLIDNEEYKKSKMIFYFFKNDDSFDILDTYCKVTNIRVNVHELVTTDKIYSIYNRFLYTEGDTIKELYRFYSNFELLLQFLDNIKFRRMYKLITDGVVSALPYNATDITYAKLILVTFNRIVQSAYSILDADQDIELLKEVIISMTPELKVTISDFLKLMDSGVLESQSLIVNIVEKTTNHFISLFKNKEEESDIDHLRNKSDSLSDELDRLMDELDKNMKIYKKEHRFDFMESILKNTIDSIDKELDKRVDELDEVYLRSFTNINPELITLLENNGIPTQMEFMVRFAGLLPLLTLKVNNTIPSILEPNILKRENLGFLLDHKELEDDLIKLMIAILGTL